MDELGLLFRIKSESSGARKDVTELGAHVAKETSAMKAAGERDFASYRRAFEKETQAIKSGMKDAALRMAQDWGISAEGAARFVAGAKLAGTTVVAIGAAAVGAGAGIFSLVKNVSEAVDNLGDLAAQTNINIETLSALRNLTEDAGGEIGTTSAALVYFQRQMYDANDATSKQGKLFRALSIDTKDTEQAIRDAFNALYQMGEGFEQTEAAAQLFGKGGGKQVLGLIKETNGDLDSSIERYRKLKTLVGKDTVEAADKFQRELVGLQQQLRGVVTEIAVSLMPTITEAIGDVSKWLSENRQTVVSWANTFFTTVKNLAATLAPIIGGLIDSLRNLNDLLNFFKTGNAAPLQLRVAETVSHLAPSMSDKELEAYKRANPAYAKWREEFDRVLQQKTNPASSSPPSWADPSRWEVKSPSFKMPAPSDGAGGGAKDDPRIKALEEQQKEAERIYKAETDALSNQYEQRRINLQDYTDKVVAEEKKLFERRSVLIFQQRALSKGSERGKFDTELGEARSQRDKNIAKAYRDQMKELLALRRELQERVLEVQDEFDKQSINAIRARIELEENTEVEGEQRIAAIENAAYQRRRVDLIEQQDELIVLAAGKGSERARELLRRLYELNNLTKEEKEELTRFTAQANQEELTRLEAHLKALDVAEATAGEERERRIAAAQAGRLQKAIEFQRSLTALDRQHAANERALEIEELQRLERTLGFRVQRLARLTELFLAEAEVRHDSIKRQLDEEERAAIKSIKGLEDEEAKKLEIKQRYNNLRLDEDRRYGEEKKGIHQTADERARSESIEGLNPFGTAGTEEFIKTGDILKATFADIKQIGLDAFSSLASGFGQMVGAWASGANLGDNALRKMIGSVFAAVAAQAATQAILFTAYGIAALTPWGSIVYGSASQWFAAAALMASLAGISAGLGRAISPKEATPKEATTGRSGRSTGGDKPPPKVTPVVEEWQQSRATAQADMMQAAQDMRVAASQFKVAANRLHAVSAGDVVRAGAPDAVDEIIEVLQLDHNRAGRFKDLIDDAARYL